MHLTNFVLSHILTWMISNILYITLAPEEVTYWNNNWPSLAIFKIYYFYSIIKQIVNW